MSLPVDTPVTRSSTSMLYAHLLLTLLTTSQVPEPSENQFVRTTDDTGRFIVIERPGDADQRAPTVLVYEYLPQGRQLKKLYSATLVNKKMPLTRAISSDGRYFVTLDEPTGSGTGPASLVIYDLARREHSAYSGSDFLSEEIRRNLRSRKVWGGFKWYGNDFRFDDKSTEFYPTLPENCREEEVPFVVVDLRMRLPRVTSPDEFDSRSIVKEVRRQFWWSLSRETVTDHGTMLPARITREMKDSPAAFNATFRASSPLFARVPALTQDLVIPAVIRRTCVTAGREVCN